MALVGRMGRTDAAPAMAKIALSGANGALRWQAVREAIALDTAQGFCALCEIADRPGDELAGPAKNLRDTLAAQWPQLAELARCPA